MAPLYLSLRDILNSLKGFGRLLRLCVILLCRRLGLCWNLNWIYKISEFNSIIKPFYSGASPQAELLSYWDLTSLSLCYLWKRLNRLYCEDVMVYTSHYTFAKERSLAYLLTWWQQRWNSSFGVFVIYSDHPTLILPARRIYHRSLAELAVHSGRIYKSWEYAGELYLFQLKRLPHHLVVSIGFLKTLQTSRHVLHQYQVFEAV